MDKSFAEALDFRHACKVFDENKKISDEDMRFILDAGRKSPSSFGMEAWKFLVITNDELKEKMKLLCWNQPQISTCSHLVVVLALIDALKPSSGEPKRKFLRRGLDEEKTTLYLQRYGAYIEALDSDENIYNYSNLQCYIAATNMMTAAAVKSIDSCPIGGFEKQKVEDLLGLKPQKMQVSLVLPFGYRLNEQNKQLRESFEDIVEFIK